ncbi:hypothetical protein [Gemmobacter sp.]|uniref:hypothetical protein n=1 Tax=Gemmobacter sp. TaxID=1898957 RepID=UPI002AFE43E5|nr:hypothetical protein [Gemmobacter sp.]
MVLPGEYESPGSYHHRVQQKENAMTKPDAFRLHTHAVDFAANKATISLMSEVGEMVHVSFPLPTPGDQTESQLKGGSKDAAKQLLHRAIAAL